MVPLFITLSLKWFDISEIAPGLVVETSDCRGAEANPPRPPRSPPRPPPLYPPLPGPLLSSKSPPPDFHIAL